MATEIERKFLVRGEAWRALDPGVSYRQGYLSTEAARSVRVRIAGARGFLTLKGASTGASRAEYEYEIPVADAQEIFDTLCLRPRIEKVRRRIDYRGRVWEVDEFFGDNRGLVIAEVELTEVDQEVALPDWVGEEVTGDPRYYNANLVRHPYSAW